MSHRHNFAQSMREASADRARIAGTGALLAAAVGLVYANSLNGAFVLDDTGSIIGNESIRHLWPLSGPLHPPADAGVGGRPLANLTFAINYASGGLSLRGYHVVNIVIHAANTLLLFGVIRRTLSLPAQRARFREATLVAFLAALLWALHPLQTSVVDYVSQRTESLMALFYLGTIYSFIRAIEFRAIGWQVASIAACALGMATKEVMVTAPVVVFLYDSAFVSGSAREAWRRNRTVYLGLASTWIVLTALLTGLSARAVGYGLGVSPWHYVLTQCTAVVDYLRLALWPHPLIFDRGLHLAQRFGDAAPEVLATAILGAAAAVLWWRCRKAGFLAVTFFILLAPSSSVVPIVRQPVAENRMYLPLATLAVGVVLGTRVLLARRWRVVAGMAVGIAGAIFTARRNEDYSSAKSLWTDTVAKQPDNARAHDWLGMAQLEAGDANAAIASLREAVRLKPEDVQMHNNLALAFAYAGKVDDAIAQYNEALQLRPDFPAAHSSLGYILLQLGHRAEARQHFETAIRLQPDYAEAYNHLGLALPDGEAVEAFRTALRLNPSFAEAHNNLAAALFRLGQRDEAVAHFEEAVRLKPDYADARTNLQHARAAVGRAR